jgi:chromosome partitioning protein
MYTVAVVNQKGGVGKSTLATNLAAVAHLRGKRTLVLDLDRQGSAFDWYAARAEGSRLDGLGVARADKALSLPKFRELTRGYDVVFCDGPPRLSDITQAAAVAADVTLIPIRPGAFDWWALTPTLELIDAADATRAELGLPPTRRVFVVNGARARTKLTRDAAESLAGVGELAPVTVHNRVAYGDAALRGESVSTFGVAGAAAEEMLGLFNVIAARPTLRARAKRSA